MKNWLGKSFFLLLWTGALSASRGNLLDKMPIKADNPLDSVSHSVGCAFGDTSYDIDSQWHPILEPYGVMYCLQCTCNAVIKKGLLQQRGQVQCKRISHECPDVSGCAQTAILPPNSCCKICPENQADRLVSPAGSLPPTLKIEHQSASVVVAKYYSKSLLANSGGVTEFSVLLSQAANTSMPRVGKAYMTLEQSVLRVTIHLSGTESIHAVQLVDERGVTFYDTTEFTVQEIDATVKICLVWRDAFKYTDKIKSDTARLVLTAGNSSRALSGRIITITPQVLETFSALLPDVENRGYASSLSMAVVTASNSLNIRGSLVAPSVGIHGKHPVSITILRDRRVLFSQEQTISISSHGSSFNAVWPNLNTANLKQLARGRLTARLMLPGNIQLSGSITTFHHCGAIKSLITGQDALPKYETMGVAVAELSLGSTGSVHYKVEIRDIESRISEVMIETDRTSSGGSQKITRLAKDVNDRMRITVEGVYDKTDATEIQLLLEGKLFINIQTRLKASSALRGQILLVPTSQPEYILMNEPDTGMAALAWCETEDCALTCDMLVPRASVRRDGSTKAFLDYWDQKLQLTSFTEHNLMEASITKSEVQQIGSTLPTLRIVTTDTTLYGQASIPELCYAGSPKLVVPAADEKSGPRRGWVDTPPVLAHKCSYDKKIYADGESWKPEDSGLACVTCSCMRNKAQCYPVVCPVVDCPNPVTLPGECCPACPKPTDNTSLSCFFPGDHRHHAVGTVWHPFMHPGGYSKCAICFCKEGGGAYDCKQTICPDLPCGRHLHETLPGECCPTCKAAPVAGAGVRQVSDLSRMQGDSDSYSSCKVADKQYANGETFNPQIGPLGMYGNIICTCNNGEISCNTIKCNCNKKVARKNRCCMKQCGFSEDDMIRKKRRKHKNRVKDMIC